MKTAHRVWIIVDRETDYTISRPRSSKDFNILTTPTALICVKVSQFIGANLD